MKQINQLHHDLKEWFEEHSRPLPWRETYHPYHVWISEIMLQQTRIETVIDYFQRWMKKLPTVTSLAQAKEEDVLKLWEGLGYYSRARNLHKTAKIIVEQFEGELPQEAKVLTTLPGVGTYTVGAISNIAFQKPAAIVDGNVQRLFSRIFDWPEEISKKNSLEFFRNKSLDLMKVGSPRIMSQAIMEFGSRVCRPKQPLCGKCPVQKNCGAFSQETIPLRPNKNKKEGGIPLSMILLLFQYKNLYYLEKQEEKELWAGLWSFPYFTLSEKEKPSTDLAQEKGRLFSSSCNEILSLPEIRHGVTKYKVQALPFLISIKNKKNFSGKGSWYTLEHLDQLSLPKTGVVIRERLRQTAF